MFWILVACGSVLVNVVTMSILCNCTSGAAGLDKRGQGEILPHDNGEEVENESTNQGSTLTITLE